MQSPEPTRLQDPNRNSIYPAVVKLVYLVLVACFLLLFSLEILISIR